MVSTIETNSCPWMITQTFKAYLPNWQGSRQVIFQLEIIMQLRGT